MSPIIVLIAFFILLAIGLPIYLVLGSLSLILFWEEGFPLINAAQIVIDGLNSISIMAIPFFVIAATFMQQGGVAKALIDAAQTWVGSRRGGLGIVCVITATVFAAISGSSVATAMAMGTILIPAMVQRRYQRSFALGIVGSSGTLGILIPPSLAFIIYAIIAEESVPRLFLAGVIPGVLQATLFIAFIVYHTHKNNYPVEEAVSRSEFKRLNMNAIPALLLPIIVLGGIYGGFVTVTEAAALSAVVSILISVFFYKGCKLSEVMGLIAESVKATGIIIFIISSALLFGHWITDAGLASDLVDVVTEMNLKPWHFLLFMNVLMLFLGMFLEVFAVILITVPIVLPLLEQLGISPIHYGVIVTVNMELALLTPPIGLNLYVLSSISKAPISEVIRGTLPFIGIMFVLLGLVTYVPELSTWLPELVYGKG